MKPENYIVKTSIGRASRKLIWQTDEVLPLDYPIGWVIQKEEKGLRIYDFSEKSPEKQNSDSIMVFNDEWPDLLHVELPPSAAGQGRRALSIDITRVKPLRPLYLPSPQVSNGQFDFQRELYMYYGTRYFLVRYRPVGLNYTAHVGGTLAFSYNKIPTGYLITSHQDDLRVRVPRRGKKRLEIGEEITLTDHEFFQATFICAIHWWRFNYVATPNNLPPLTTDESADDLREKKRFQKSVQFFILAFLVATANLMLFTSAPPPKVIETQVAIKQPKIILRKEEFKLKPTPTPPPQVVKLDPPKEKPKPESKPAPKKVVEKKPPPKKIAAAPKNAPKAEKPKPPPVVKSPAPPAPGLVAKVATPAPAPPPPNPNAQILKSLSFLSPSKNRPAAVTPQYADKSNKFKGTTPFVGGGSKNSVINDIASNTSSDSNISTKSARTVAGEINFGSGNGPGKGLNQVQGKVSANELYNPNAKLGGGLGGSGLNISGTGEVSDSEIEKALSKFLSRFQHCYEKALLSDASLGGDIRIRWTIQTSGKAASPKVIQSQMKNEGLNSCLFGVLKEIPFPKPKGGTVNVEKTFNFKSATL